MRRRPYVLQAQGAYERPASLVFNAFAFENPGEKRPGFLYLRLQTPQCALSVLSQPSAFDPLRSYSGSIVSDCHAALDLSPTGRERSLARHPAGPSGRLHRLLWASWESRC